MVAPSFGSIVLGGNVFGWTVAKDEAFRLLDAYVDHGGAAIDTADLYPSWAPGCRGGESEEIVGAWMLARKNRSRIVLATKVAKWSERPGLSAKNIALGIDDSLRRLRTDYVDVYFAHEDDPKIAQLETMQAFDALVRAGKVRALGASNFSADRLASAVAVARREGLASYAVSQDHWNLVHRDAERDLVPLLEREGIAETPFWALASGFLTGKYRPGTTADSARGGGAAKYLNDPKNVRLLAVLDRIAEAREVSVAAVALAWLRAQPSVAAPIASARTIAQLGPLFEDAKLDATDLADLSAV